MDRKGWLDDLHRLLHLAERVDEGIHAMRGREQWDYQVAVSAVIEQKAFSGQDSRLAPRLATWLWHATVDGDFRFAAWDSGLWDLRGYDP